MAASESSEQRMLVNHLDLCPVEYCAIPNGGLRDKRTARTMVAEGLKKGMPDILIFDRPPDTKYIGTALEMKRSDGTPADVTPKQREKLAMLAARGWKTLIGYGYMDAAAKLKALGYPV